MRYALIAASLLVCGAAHAQETPRQPLPPPQPIEQPAPQPEPPPTCNIPGHPNAVCFWADPGAQDCFPDVLPKNPTGQPAVHFFDGRAVCWSGSQGLLAIARRRQ